MNQLQLCKTIILAAVLGLETTSFAQAFDEKYTYDQLRSFWQESLGQTNSTTLAEIYRNALINADLTQGVQKVETATLPSTPASQSQVVTQIIATITNPGGGSAIPPAPLSQPYIFSTYRLDSTLQNQILDRQLKLQSYLARAQKFDVAGLASQQEAGSEATQSLLQQQQTALNILFRSAQLEMYYINIARSAQASSLQAKCRYITEAERFQKTFQDPRGFIQALGVKQAFETTPYKPLGDIFPAVYDRYKKYLQEKIACQSNELKSQSQLLGKIESTVNSRVVSYLQDPAGKPRVVLDKINEIVGEYEAILAGIQVDPKTKELLELERNISNVQSNLSLVKQDQLKVGRDIVAVETIDLRTVEKLTMKTQKPAHPLITRVYNLRLQVVDAVKGLLTKIEDVYTKAGNDKAKINACQNLAKSYQDLMAPSLNEENNNTIRNISNTSINDFNQKYSSCLSQMTIYVRDLKSRTEFDEYLEQFAAKLGDLSAEVLRVKNESGEGL